MRRSFPSRSPAKPFFDPKEFRKEINSSNNPIKVFKSTIEGVRKTLNQRFLGKTKIDELIYDNTWFIDHILIAAWEQYDWKDADDVTLLAVGGYGRGELHPFSDIDIQILLKSPSQRKKYKNNIENFLTFLWDISLEVGQSVRTIRENRQEAAKDITIVTTLTEARTLYGNPSLQKQLMAEVNQKKIWKPKAFFAAKVAEQKARHERHNDVEYALEPNIKVAPGGLRDLQTIGWIAKRYYDSTELSDLVAKGFLQKNEYQDLIKARNFLWRIRYGLHMVADRREDRLLFEYQRKLAELFGYKDDSKSLGIEKLMQEYYRVVLTVRELNDVLLQLFDEDIIRSKERVKIVTLNSRFQIRNNYIEVVNTRVFKNTPSALIEIFVLMAQDRKIEGIRASTIRLIRNSCSLIDANFRKDIRNKTLFIELLRSTHKVVHRLRQMKRYGILSAYLPEFGKIVGQMQHDLFHIYTVDDHTLQVMENMRLLRHEEAEKKFPIAAQIIKRLPKLELLYVAGLYHDIAKGRGGDHSTLGAVDAELFCRRHYFGKWDTNLVTWLVENHLVMSAIAQREDIQDPEVIRNFALKVGDRVRLDYLFALTVCDINATNPTLWTSWRASLMRQLYNSTRQLLSQGLEQIVDKKDWIKDNQKQTLRKLSELGISKSKAESLWQNPDEDYFFRESPEDIVWHTRAIAEYHKGDGPLILLKNSTNNSNEGATQVFIYAHKSNFLFANIASAFERLNLNICDARIFNTSGDFCMQTFMVLEHDGSLIGSNKTRIKQIRDSLIEHISNEKLMPSNKTRASRKQRHFSRKTFASINNDDNTATSKLEVLCPDRPGLLAKIASVFVSNNIVIRNAKITTLGENVEDVFYISDEKNKPITSKAKIEKLLNSIRTTLDAEVNT